jgi:hypothetical protein
MLRFFVLLLLLANGLYFAWSQGLLGAAPSEAQRMEQQVRPEALRILSPAELRQVEAQASAPPNVECLEAGLFDEAQSSQLRQALQARLPAGSWVLQASVRPARWIVYMGKYPSADSAGKKKQELKARGVAFEPLRNAALEPGIALGGFDSPVSANQLLKELTQRGVRTARVVVEQPEQRGDLLRLPAADEKQRAALEEIRPGWGAASLRACAK